MSKNAIFIDLGGNTARVDPQGTLSSYIRLQIINQAQYDNVDGYTAHPPEVFEIYVSADQADLLAEALKSARHSNKKPYKL